MSQSGAKAYAGPARMASVNSLIPLSFRVARFRYTIPTVTILTRSSFSLEVLRSHESSATKILDSTRRIICAYLMRQRAVGAGIVQPATTNSLECQNTAGRQLRG